MFRAPGRMPATGRPRPIPASTIPPWVVGPTQMIPSLIRPSARSVSRIAIVPMVPAKPLNRCP